ncbi:MAG TPA: ABC-2 family transporter protein [Aggregatilinea sp.]|jgi:ABC-2 type transport system permease protein|uniref:ABC transporter permease n=1 Tax=Aggregatilinea sp. TaxID=2806333 RepID=UPI002BC70168|nr:ABC-2 family transporter protein [Aggregatilinea sp.]HML24864.1 ABC-2 family transporter protein [Aggregatilinea sp.]
MARIGNEIGFVLHMVKLNLAGIMEYRASFLMQAVGMFINNGIYFVFWLLFFDRFQEIRGYQIEQIYLLFAIVALGWGLAFTLAGNASQVAPLIAQGRLDYYLTLPRPVVLHLLFSRMDAFSMGDLTFGLVAFLLAGHYDPVSIGLFLLCSALAAVIFACFLATAGCLSFFVGNATQWASYMANAMVTFALYPMGLFQGAMRLILYTLIPAGFVGAVPVKVVETHSITLVMGLAGAALASALVLVLVFRLGLRRYESGSAINVNI